MVHRRVDNVLDKSIRKAGVGRSEEVDAFLNPNVLELEIRTFQLFEVSDNGFLLQVQSARFHAVIEVEAVVMQCRISSQMEFVANGIAEHMLEEVLTGGGVAREFDMVTARLAVSQGLVEWSIEQLAG